jgi:hypothetical protein
MASTRAPIMQQLNIQVVEHKVRCTKSAQLFQRTSPSAPLLKLYGGPVHIPTYLTSRGSPTRRRYRCNFFSSMRHPCTVRLQYGSVRCWTPLVDGNLLGLVNAEATHRTYSGARPGGELVRLSAWLLATALQVRNVTAASINVAMTRKSKTNAAIPEVASPGEQSCVTPVGDPVRTRLTKPLLAGYGITYSLD